MLQQWQKSWYENFIAADYSFRNLTYPNDKLNAISGIASAFHKLRPSRYLAGHWEENLTSSLCWSSSSLHGKKHKPDVYRAPSRSWASMDCEVIWDLWSKTPIIPAAEILEVHTDVDPANFGEVAGEFLKLRAPTLRGRVSLRRKDFFVLLHDNGIEDEAMMDLDVIVDGELSACLLGFIEVTGSSVQYKWITYSLLVSHIDGVSRRVGMVRTLYGRVARGLIHGLEELELKRYAPLEDYTII